MQLWLERIFCPDPSLTVRGLLEGGQCLTHPFWGLPSNKAEPPPTLPLSSELSPGCTGRQELLSRRHWAKMETAAALGNRSPRPGRPQPGTTLGLGVGQLCRPYWEAPTLPTAAPAVAELPWV